MSEKRLVQRADKVAFMKVEDKHVRMKGFTTQAISKNPKEYTRQYVDELFETTDVVGISSSIEFAFDQFKGDLVHDKLVQIIDEERVGTDSVVEIMIVDFTKEDATTPGTFEARKRKYSVIPNTEGGSLDAYTYEGTLRVNGAVEVGTATTTDDWATATFAPAVVEQP